MAEVETKVLLPPKDEKVTPFHSGLVQHAQGASALLRATLDAAGHVSLRKSRLLVCTHPDNDPKARRAIEQAIDDAGAALHGFAPSPVAAAFGAGLPVRDPVGSLIIDVGAARTQVAVVSLGGVVVSRTEPVGGRDLDTAIADWISKRRGVVVTARAAETLKIRVGSLAPEVHFDLRMRVRGRAVRDDHEREVEVTASDIADAIQAPMATIRQVITETLRVTPPELCADVVDRGVLLCGGSSHLRGLDAQIRADTGLPVLQASEPERAVARGAATLLEDPELTQRLLL